MLTSTECDWLWSKEIITTILVAQACNKQLKQPNGKVFLGEFIFLPRWVQAPLHTRNLETTGSASQGPITTPAGRIVFFGTTTIPSRTTH